MYEILYVTVYKNQNNTSSIKGYFFCKTVNFALSFAHLAIIVKTKENVF